jgi:predicted ATPase
LALVKEVAQVAACLGREFSHEMLLAVSPLGTDALETALERLAASGLIRRQGAAPAALYAFRHALVQEAAYQSLLRTRRRELHACIARAVEDRFPEVAARQPEWVAHHCTEARLGLLAGSGAPSQGGVRPPRGRWAPRDVPGGAANR